MDYRESSVPAPTEARKKAFAYQAAQFAFWGPIVGLGLGCGLNVVFAKPEYADRPEIRYAWLALAGINLMVGLGAVVLGIIAMTAIRKLGTKFILWRSIIGICLGLLILGAFAYFLTALESPGGVARRLVGEWNGKVPIASIEFDMRLTLRDDQHATLVLSGNNRTIQVDGRWQLGLNRDTKKYLLGIKFDPGQESALGSGTQWQIERITSDELVLLERRADGAMQSERFSRVNP